MRSVGKIVGRLVGTFAFLGAILGIVGLAMLWQAGVFDAPEGGRINFGAAIMSATITLMVGIFVALGGILVAVVAGVYAARAFPLSRRNAVLAGFGGGGLGHLSMGVAFALVLAAGYAVLEPPVEDTAARDESGGVDWSGLMERMLLAMLPAALVGGGTAAILHVSPRGATVMAVRQTGGAPPGLDDERAPLRMAHEQTVAPER